MRFLVLIILLVPSVAYAGLFDKVMTCYNAAAGGAVCASYEANTTDNDYENCGVSDSTRYCGMTYNYGSPQDICKVCFKLTEVGDIDAKTIYFEVWSKTGTALNAVLTSGSFSGALIDGTLVCADVTPYTLASSTDYAITASTHETDSNYFQMRTSSTSVLAFGVATRWDNTKALQATFAGDPVIDLYAQ